MANVRNGAVVKSLGVLLRSGSVAGLSDGQLLERFMRADREVAELAFAALVDRHGPMVRRICRQVLGDLHDSQDVFQATFFILARKARAVRRRDSVASWLHGVAYRVCLRTRLAAARRRLRERTAATLAVAQAPEFDASETRETGELIHAELARLPERFRAPIVLCDLQDMAYEEAARLIGCPVGTVKSRLARGRDRLRVRLIRRGLAPLAGLLVAPAVRAAVPSALRDATARAAIRFTMYGPQAVGGAVSTTAVSLTEGMIHSMVIFRLRVAALVLAVSGSGTTAVAVLAGTEPGAAALTIERTSRAVDPITSERPSEEFPVGALSRIDFEGNTTVSSDKITPKLLSRVGEPVDRKTVETDLGTLMTTKWFSDVWYYLDESPPKSGTWALVFVVHEMPLWTKVEFRGRKAIRLKEIEDTTGLKAGNRADPVRARAAVGQILRLYQAKGYDPASVTLRKGGDVGDTEIVIEIFEGPKVTVHSIDFEGNHFASAAQLKTRIGTRKPILGLSGERHSDTLDDYRKVLVDYYQSEGFFDAKVTTVTRPRAESGQVDVTFTICEGTRYKVRDVIIEGNTKLRTETLRKGLDLGFGKPFTAATRETEKNGILLKYGEIGFIDAQSPPSPGSRASPESSTSFARSRKASRSCSTSDGFIGATDR